MRFVVIAALLSACGAPAEGYDLTSAGSSTGEAIQPTTSGTGTGGSTGGTSSSASSTGSSTGAVVIPACTQNDESCDPTATIDTVGFCCYGTCNRVHRCVPSDCFVKGTKVFNTTDSLFCCNGATDDGPYNSTEELYTCN